MNRENLSEEDKRAREYEFRMYKILDECNLMLPVRGPARATRSNPEEDYDIKTDPETIH